MKSSPSLLASSTRPKPNFLNVLSVLLSLATMLAKTAASFAPIVVAISLPSLSSNSIPKSLAIESA